MSDLSDALTEYLTMRRSLGFTFRLPASLLRRFIAFVERAGSPFITTDLALQWAMQPTDVQPCTWTWRLGIARRFAMWRRASDPRTEVPADGCYLTATAGNLPGSIPMRTWSALSRRQASCRPPKNCGGSPTPPSLGCLR